MNDYDRDYVTKALFSLCFGLVFLAFSPLDLLAGRIVAGVGGAAGIGLAIYLYVAGRRAELAYRKKWLT